MTRPDGKLFDGHQGYIHTTPMITSKTDGKLGFLYFFQEFQCHKIKEVVFCHYIVINFHAHIYIDFDTVDIVGTGVV